MPRPTISVDDWKCPSCKAHNRFESDAAGAEAVGDLSGFVDTVECLHCGKPSSVSLSIQFRAELITE